jgi:hypothetical protein
MADVRTTELEAALRAIPAEAFIDGPPADGELLLRRTLRQVRTEGPAEAGGPAQLSVALRPVAGRHRLTARVTGVPAGKLCRLVVVHRDGARRTVRDLFPAGDDVAATVDDIVAVELTDAGNRVLASVATV